MRGRGALVRGRAGLAVATWAGGSHPGDEEREREMKKKSGGGVRVAVVEGKRKQRNPKRLICRKKNNYLDNTNKILGIYIFFKL